VHLPSATYFEKQVHIDDKGFCVFTFSKTCIKLQAPTQNLQIVHDVSWISDRTSHVSVYVLDTSREHNVDLHMKLANLILYFSHRSIISCDSLCSTWHIMCLPKYAIKTLLICVPCAFYRLPSLFGKTCWVSLRGCAAVATALSILALAEKLMTIELETYELPSTLLVLCYLRSLLIDSDLVQLYTKSGSIEKDRREYL
jgi:hypothetical protein